jgi:hypothetical protein
MSTNKWTSFVPSSHPMGNSITTSLDEGSSKTFSSELGISGAISEVTSNSGTVTKTDNSITFQSAEYGSPEKVVINYSVKKGDVTVKERIVVKMTKRKPILKDTTIAVSYKNPTKFTLAKLGASNPESREAKSISVTDAKVSAGTVTSKEDSLTFTPAGQGEVTLTYTVKNVNGTATATIKLLCQNMAPNIYAKANMGNKPNTNPIDISLTTMRASDADGDVVKFRTGYLAPDYPGKLELSSDSTTVTYTPDGVADSKIGIAVFNLTGSGSPISVTAPTTIPGYTPPVAIKQLAAPAISSSLKVGRENVTLGLVKSGRVVVDIYSVKGLRVKTVLDQNLSAGVHTVGFDASTIPAGTYIVRMRQGSTVKSQWFVNR